MSERGNALAAAAEQFIGTPFKLHGRDPRTGLDCVGVVAAALQAIGCQPTIPSGYRLRQTSVERHILDIGRCGFGEVTGFVESGDVLLVCPGPAQHHLLISLGDDQVVHAHAILRRVVRGALPTEWPVLRHWRLTE